MFYTHSIMPTYTQEQYTILTAAIAQGALKVKYADKEVEYRSLNEMLHLQQIMANDLGLNGDSPKTNGRFYGSFSNGIQ